MTPSRPFHSTPPHYPFLIDPDSQRQTLRQAGRPETRPHDLVLSRLLFLLLCLLAVHSTSLPLLKLAALPFYIALFSPPPPPSHTSSSSRSLCSFSFIGRLRPAVDHPPPLPSPVTAYCCCSLTFSFTLLYFSHLLRSPFLSSPLLDCLMSKATEVFQWARVYANTTYFQHTHNYSNTLKRPSLFPSMCNSDPETRVSHSRVMHGRCPSTKEGLVGCGCGLDSLERLSVIVNCFFFFFLSL